MKMKGITALFIPWIRNHEHLASNQYYDYHDISYYSTSLSATGRHSSRNILSVEECLALSKCDRVVFVDGSWHMPNSNPKRDARKEFEDGPRIPGAKFFDIDDICSKGEAMNPKGLPHMMPTAQMFSAAMDAMGIKNDDRVIVYASQGCFAAPRTWFTFKSMAFDPSRVHIMDGGLVDWVAKGGQVEIETMQAVKAHDFANLLDAKSTYQAREPTNIVNMNDVLRSINDKDSTSLTTTIVDARSSGRFSGKDPEPRPGLKGGHMPGAKNIFFLDFHDANDTLKFKTLGEMKDILSKNKLIGSSFNASENIISTCGTGVTACSLILALTECGKDFETLSVYDGSWTEWGDPNENVPIVTDFSL